MRLRQLGTRVGLTPSEALASPDGVARVLAALTQHSVICLKPEPGVSPSALAQLTASLAAARHAGHAGLVAPAVPEHATLPRVTVGEHADAVLAPPGAGFALSNVRLADAAALGVAPMYHSGGLLEEELAPGERLQRDVCSSPRIGCDSNLAAVWHQDDQFRRLPASFTLLYCVASPPAGVADTEYADTQVGWATLPEALRARLLDGEGKGYRMATHSLNTVETGLTKTTDHDAFAHPLVLQPPARLGGVEGAPSLYLGSRNGRVAGLSAEASLALMEELIAHCAGGCGGAAPPYAHAHEPGGLVIACNRTTMHRASSGCPLVATVGRGDARHVIRFQAEEPCPPAEMAAPVQSRRGGS